MDAISLVQEYYGNDWYKLLRQSTNGDAGPSSPMERPMGLWSIWLVISPIKLNWALHLGKTMEPRMNIEYSSMCPSKWGLM